MRIVFHDVWEEFWSEMQSSQARGLEAERPASTDEGTQEKLQQLHCLEEEVGAIYDALPE